MVALEFVWEVGAYHTEHVSCLWSGVDARTHLWRLHPELSHSAIEEFAEVRLREG